MKKLFLFLTLALTMVMSAYAGAPKGQHAEFLGIPINGKVASFSTQLKNLGYTYDAETTSQLSAGKRAYDGIFEDYYASVWACFDPETNLMYGVCVFINCLDYDDAVDAAISLGTDISLDLDADCDDDNADEDSIRLIVHNTSGKEVGSVDIDLIDGDDGASVMIFYFDKANLNKYNNHK